MRTMRTSIEELDVGSYQGLVNTDRDIFKPAYRIVTIFP